MEKNISCKDWNINNPDLFTNFKDDTIEIINKKSESVIINCNKDLYFEETAKDRKSVV